MSVSFVWRASLPYATYIAPLARIVNGLGDFFFI